MTPTTRRAFLGACTVGFAALCGRQAGDDLPPARSLTHGPKHHWFGYYDKLEFDPANRLVRGMEVGFEHRSPRPDDEIRIGMVGLIDGDRWTDLGRSTSWSWQ